MFRLLSLLGALLLILQTATAEAPEKLTIGAISVLSGEGASWGVNQQRGSLLAMEEANSRGGINGREIEIIFEDSSGGLARNAVSAYNRLVHGKGVRFILGPVAMDELLAVAPLAVKDGVFLGGATYMPSAPENFFTTWIDADIESDLAAAHVFKSHKRIGILSSQQSWESQVGKRVRESFTRLGGEVVAFEEPSFEAIEVKSEVLRARQKKPEAFFYFKLPAAAKVCKRAAAPRRQSAPVQHRAGSVGRRQRRAQSGKPRVHRAIGAV